VKSVGLVPLLPIAVTVRVDPPVLVTVTGIVLVVPTEVDGKVSEVAESVTAGPAVPVPLSVTRCGDPLALSVMFSVAEKGPAAEGVKLTWTVQELPGAIWLPPQLLV
jgi:hypothetical protein